MLTLHTQCIKLYRKIVPARVRDTIGKVRSRKPAWTVAQAPSGRWYFSDYTKPRWDTEYRTDRWRYMSGLEELSRYSVVVGYVRFFKPDAKVLDLGSGEGILQERFGYESYSRYLGVDVSQAAIDAARTREDSRTSFVCADVATFVPDGKFDVVVFNEVLYYLREPLAVMKHYEKFLSPGGIFIVSMFNNEELTHNWTTLECAYDFFDETRASNSKSGCSWSCRVWQSPCPERAG